jgi:hypothetical protein
VFDHWEGDRPVGHDEPAAWTQILAVSQDQTKNTMKLFPSLISPEAQRHYGMQIGKLNVWSDGDRRQIEAVTASVLAIEGGRPKQIVRAETQNWTSANAGTTWPARSRATRRRPRLVPRRASSTSSTPSARVVTRSLSGRVRRGSPLRATMPPQRSTACCWIASRRLLVPL